MNKKTLLIILILLIVVSILTYNQILFKKQHSSNNKSQEIALKEKLNILGNINTKINYFHESYIDRYVQYKQKHTDMSNDNIVLNVNIGLDQEFYTNIKKAINLNTNYILVNKFNYLNDDYVPNNLEKIDTRYAKPDKTLIDVARISFEFLAKKAMEEGYQIRAVSTYRSYTYQNNLYNNYVNQDGVEKADKYSARPGFSEHQTGLAVDVDNRISDFNQFEHTKEFEWMQNNAYKYGFILRYPKNKENITGYIYEPWHYRYVGIDIATFIHNNNITFEEYYAKYIEAQ